MSYFSVNKKGEKRDKLKSAAITIIVWTALLLFISVYSVKIYHPQQTDAVNTMLINFGDEHNGNGEEEPKEQEGSLAASEPTPVEEVAPVKESTKPEPTPVVEEKIITGKSEKHFTSKTEKADKKLTPKASAKAITSPQKKAISKSNAGESHSKNKEAKGDGRGTSAIGNLLKGRGSKTGTQGVGGKAGNAGDPLGGDGNGDSKIGVDRKLIAYIPGTMGRGGAQPSHSCSASGSIALSYTVDKAGNVISVRRIGGLSDPCVVGVSSRWIKQYVKAEKANFSSTGTYRISF
ncbi:ferric siderophore ABC transporter substrate-binding protein [Elizabethkingia argentiflava]|uniref:Ferric siderophore ABC transporter substrate-binding protein n=1 Tax=Elizabethkingia argenteiflava TaxID=2681556 RepID=A0A845PUE4_9FLAO|nr:ferric siderophore ABC transporter substrate-binding protein [Elizabethkingia argenteiflava]NAW50713.1 ferric siderophore ABC transporter substrate-binding protein [Elizabethkingia argenteiflava]